MLAGLPIDQFEWQFADPSSSIARAKYRPGDVYAYIVVPYEILIKN